MLNHENQKWRSEEIKQKSLTHLTMFELLHPPHILTWGSKKKPLAQMGFQVAEFVFLLILGLEEIAQFLLWVWSGNGIFIGSWRLG